MPPRSPFVGLDPYTEADREYFFGRRREQRILAANLTASRLTVLHGSSGVGKSSVLLAGVVPDLRAATRRVVVIFRDWQRGDFYVALRGECARAAPPDCGIDAALPLDDLVARIAETTSARVCLLLDQFEEYLLTAPPSAGAEFEAALSRVINRTGLDAAVLLSLRDDGLALLDRLRSRIPNLLANTFRLQHLEASAAIEAITKALERYSEQCRATGHPPVTAEPELVKAVVAEVRPGRLRLTGLADTRDDVTAGETDRVEAPYLQLVMTRLFDEDARFGVLRLATLERLHGAAAIVGEHFDGIMRSLDRADRDACARFFDRLVTPSGNKIAVTAEDLRTYAGNLGPRVPGVLRRLSEARILRHVAPSADRPLAPRCEIFHDVLGPAVLEWRRDHVRHAQWRRRLQIGLAVVLGILIVAAPFAYVSLTRTRAKVLELAALRAEELAQQAPPSERDRLFEKARKGFRAASDGYDRGFDTVGEKRATHAAERLVPWGYLLDVRRGTVHALRAEVVRVGRDVPDRLVQNDIPFGAKNRTVSRHHLEIRRQRFEVEDLRSTAGTMLGAAPLQYGGGGRMKDGDVLVLGSTEVLQFRTERPPAVGASKAAWAIVVHGNGWSALTGPEYSIGIDGGALSIVEGETPAAAARLRRSPSGSAELTGTDRGGDLRWGLVYSERFDVLVANFSDYLLPEARLQLQKAAGGLRYLSEVGKKVPPEEWIEPWGRMFWVTGPEGEGVVKRFVVVQLAPTPEDQPVGDSTPP